MCGYCMESAVISEPFWRLKGEVSEAYEPYLYPIQLQESTDWRQELESWNSSEHLAGNLVALCRHWSERIAGSDPAPLIGVLSSDALVDLHSWVAIADYPPEWQWVLCGRGPLPNPLPLELARARLDLYIDAWLEESRSGESAWDQKSLHDNFLSVSVAFDVLMRAAADDPRFKLLAIELPNEAPSPAALDLWLQRRALWACVARSGVPFIKEHYDDLRLEAILSVVWSDLLNGDALRDLHTWLQGRPHWSTNIDPADFLEAIKMKADLVRP